VRFEPGQFVFREGEEANQFYLIRHGKVTSEIHAPPRGSIIIQTLGEGDVLGWSWLFPPYRWKKEPSTTAPLGVVRYLSQHFSEILNELQTVSEGSSLES
jgi:hypothetical protein